MTLYARFGESDGGTRLEGSDDEGRTVDTDTGRGPQPFGGGETPAERACSSITGRWPETTARELAATRTIDESTKRPKAETTTPATQRDRARVTTQKSTKSTVEHGRETG